MAKNHHFFKSQFTYFLSLLSIVFLCFNLQGHFLSQLKNPWFHVDFLSIVIVYVALERSLLLAVSIGAVAGFLLQTSATSSHFFFLFYFILLILLADVFFHYFVIQSQISKCFLFSLLFSLKFILFYFSLKHHRDIPFSLFFGTFWQEYTTTCLVSFCFYPLLFKLDFLFSPPDTIKRR